MRLRLHREGAILRIELDDGGMNLLSSAALDELTEAIGAAGPDVRVLTFCSGREGLFAAGADMREMAGFTPADAESFSRKGQELFARIERLPAITIAAIEGDCFGGALDLALAFDWRIAGPESRFAHPGARIGIVTGFGGTTRWRKWLAAPAARRLFLGNEVFSAGEALDAGLVDEIAAHPHALLPRRAERWSGAPTGRIRVLKELLARKASMTPAQLDRLGELLAELYGG